MSAFHVIKNLGSLATAALVLSACSGTGSGHLTLVPRPAKQSPVKGSPLVSMNQGGQSLIIEQGKTASTGVHGWVAIQSVGSGTLNAAGGGTAVIQNAPVPTNGGRGLSSQ